MGLSLKNLQNLFSNNGKHQHILTLSFYFTSRCYCKFQIPCLTRVSKPAIPICSIKSFLCNIINTTKVRTLLKKSLIFRCWSSIWNSYVFKNYTISNEIRSHNNIPPAHIRTLFEQLQFFISHMVSIKAQIMIHFNSICTSRTKIIYVNSRKDYFFNIYYPDNFNLCF